MVTVRQPGSVVEWYLPQEQEKDPSERTVFLLKVLTWDQWKNFIRKLENLTKFSSPGDVLEATRKAIGVGLIDVKNLKLLDQDGREKDFVLERSGDDIAPGSMAVLMPFKDQLLEAINQASRFGFGDAKNSL